METLGIVVGMIGGFVPIYFALKRSMKSAIKEQTDPIARQLDILQKDIDSLTKADCKNFLVSYLSDKEKGVPMSSAVEARAYEVKDRYKAKNGNSYIKDEWERIMKTKW